MILSQLLSTGSCSHLDDGRHNTMSRQERKDCVGFYHFWLERGMLRSGMGIDNGSSG